jgi:hypothetical protein
VEKFLKISAAALEISDFQKKKASEDTQRVSPEEEER